MNEHRSQTEPARTAPAGDHAWALAEVERLQHQLETLQAELIWSNRLTTLGTLSAVLAHEYNNLLTPIASYAQLALKQPGDAALVHKALTAAVENVQRATRVASATLGFASPETNTEQGDGTTTLPAAADAALACLGRPLEHDGIELAVDLTNEPLAIVALQMQQVLINLITNARKAMLGAPGPSRLSLVSKREGDGVLLEVADSGPGMPDAVLERAFEPFVTAPTVQSDTTSSQAAKGTGLGLSICRDLVESAGGWIMASSSKAGTTLRLWLPLA